MYEPTWSGATETDVTPPPFAAARLAPEPAEREPLIREARPTDAGQQFLRSFSRWRNVLDHLRWAALVRLTRNEPADRNHPGAWRSRDQHAQAVLRRHGITNVNTSRLTTAAVARLIDGQARADRDAGLDWPTLTVRAPRLDERLRHALARLPIALDDPAVYAFRDDQRRALAGRLGLSGEQAEDLSRWLLANPSDFEPDDLNATAGDARPRGLAARHPRGEAGAGA